MESTDQSYMFQESFKEIKLKLKVLTQKRAIPPVLLQGAEIRSLTDYFLGKFSVCEN